MATADEKAAEKIGRLIDARITDLNAERAALLNAETRIPEIDAELVALRPEKERIDPRRPRSAAVDDTSPTPENPRNVNPTR